MSTFLLLLRRKHKTEWNWWCRKKPTIKVVSQLVVHKLHILRLQQFFALHDFCAWKNAKIVLHQHLNVMKGAKSRNAFCAPKAAACSRFSIFKMTAPSNLWLFEGHVFVEYIKFRNLNVHNIDIHRLPVGAPFYSYIVIQSNSNAEHLLGLGQRGPQGRHNVFWRRPDI